MLQRGETKSHAQEKASLLAAHKPQLWFLLFIKQHGETFMLNAPCIKTRHLKLFVFKPALAEPPL